jgi:hypothetical protein
LNESIFELPGKQVSRSCAIDLHVYLCHNYGLDAETEVSEELKTLEIMRKFSEQYAKR